MLIFTSFQRLMQEKKVTFYMETHVMTLLNKQKINYLLNYYHIIASTLNILPVISLKNI
jgi:hypothetical protein